MAARKPLMASGLASITSLRKEITLKPYSGWLRIIGNDHAALTYHQRGQRIRHDACLQLAGGKQRHAVGNFRDGNGFDFIGVKTIRLQEPLGDVFDHGALRHTNLNTFESIDGGDSTFARKQG